MRSWFLPSLVAVLACMQCDNGAPNDTPTNREGIRVFLTSVDRGAGSQLFDPDTVALPDTCVLDHGEIAWYDTGTHVLRLTFPRNQLLERIGAVSVRGNPFVLCVDGQRVYGGWFWTSASSFSCDAIAIVSDPSDDSLHSNELPVRLGYPNEDTFAGIDLRAAPLVLETLAADGKLR
ncbi:MAG: hypothetical protein GF331_25885 [Chitinivibrionales bacterium]|nr:hypothetical protein [Chitinivibrionales bacterium]